MTLGHSDRRAVSDVVAFVLTFAIIISGVGIVSVGGFDRLTEFTNEQEVDNSERAMEAAAATVDTLHRNSDTYREFDLTLSGGTVVVNQTSLTIKSDGPNDLNLSELGADKNEDEATIRINALEHRFDLSDKDTAIAYEGGGVFRTETTRPGYEPSFSFDGDTAIISLVNLTTDNTIGRANEFERDIVVQPTGIPEGSPASADNQLTCFSARLEDQQRIYETDDVSALEIDASGTAYPGLWEFYFENRDDGNWDVDGSAYELDGTLDSVLLRVSTIELSKRQSDCGAVILSN
jgi:FlaG/FlaF family flagellin (archaellin)